METTTLITTIVISVIVLSILNFISVFGAMATLRWIDQRQKLAMANIFMREVGEKLQTEANFQDIIKNMQIKKEKEEDESKDND